MHVALILCALVLAGIVLVRSKGEDLNAWAIVALALALGAAGYLRSL